MTTATPYIAIPSFQNYNPGPDWRTYYDYSPSRVPNAKAGAAYSGVPLGAVYGAVSGYEVSDGAGYTFQLRPDGSLKVIKAPVVGKQVRNADGSLSIVQKQWGVGTVYSPGTSSYELIVARLKARDPDFEAALGGHSTGATADTTKQTFSLASFVSGFGLSTPEGQAAAASFLEQQGPGIADAVRSLFQSRGRSLTDLLKRLAEIRSKLPGISDPTRRAKLQAEAQGIQSEITMLQQAQADPLLNPGASLPDPGVPFWVWPTSVLGIVAAGGLLFYVVSKRKRKR